MISLGFLGFLAPATAQTVTATNGLSCAGDREGSDLGCTAGEFTSIVNITNQPGSPTSCVAGDYVTLIGSVGLSGTNADRYNVGFFTGENGNDPRTFGTGKTCSVATFPTNPLPWFAKNADVCGDYEAAGVASPVINNIKVLCAGDASGALKVPYTLVYSQTAYACSGPTDVVVGNKAKCNAGTATVSTATFTVNGSVTVTKQTVPAGDAQSFSFTANGTGPVMSGDGSFNLTHNGSKRVRMGINDTARTLTITEAAADPNQWEPAATIACTQPDGSSSTGFVATDGANRTITATLSNTNPNALCTITNTRRTTTIATGTDPAAATIAPGAATTDVDQFTLQTSGGTETITSVTVNLSTNSGIARLAIFNSTGTELGYTTSPVAGANIIGVSGMSATATLATFRVRVTPMSHAAMPAVPGGAYAITAPVTAWAGPNIHSGSDTNSNALTIDNQSPTGATATSISAVSQQPSLNWTTSASGDFATTSGSVIYRWSAATAGSEVPVEGSTPAFGATNGSATVACVVSSAAATALSRINGPASSSGECMTSALTVGQPYAYKVFQKDANGNYDAGVALGSFTQAPAVISINRAGTSPAGVGATVSWTVVFNASVTGVDTSDFSLVQAAGVTGATITSVTGAGTTWTVSANTGVGTGTLGLNLVDDDTIITAAATPLGGAGSGNGNFTGQVYNILNCFTDSFTGADNASPGSNWTRTSSSGSFGLPRIFGNRLRLTDASGNVATAAHLQRQFPGAGNKIIVEFDYFAYNGSGADGIALTFSDATVTPQAGAYGGSLGYAQRTGVNGFAGGWLGVGLDEWGNFANPTEGRNGGTGFTVDSVTVRGSGSGQTGYAYHTTSGTLAPGVDQPGVPAGPGHRYRITLDHSNGVNAYVLVERDTSGTGSSYTTVIPQYDAKVKAGQAGVPANWLLSYTGSTGGSTNIHEIDNLSVCTTQPIQPIGPYYLRIEHGGSGVTCKPTTVTVKACVDAACSSLYAGGATGTLTATGTPTANWVGGAGFSIGATGTTTKDVQVTTAGTVTWGAAGVAPTPGTTSCYVGATASCDFTASIAGFIFDVPNHVSDTLQTVNVSAVKQSDSSLACVPAFASVSKAVSFACSYSNPSSGTLPVAVNATNIACGTASNVNLAFNASGVASTTFRYADVGNIGLAATYTGSSETTESGLSMTGTDSFIAAPASFTVVPAGPYIAGSAFSATVTAKNASGNATPNFGKEATPATATLTHALAGATVGKAGGAAADFVGSLGAFGATTAGVASGNNLAWKEVGDINVTSTLTGGSYLGSGLTATGTGPAGPFKPAYFETVVTPAAGTFSYSGQPFTVKVTAKSNWAGNPTTTNYDNTLGYAKAVTLTDANAATNTSSTLGAFANASVPAASFASGVATVNNVTYTFTTKTTAPLEVTASLPLKLRATETADATVSSNGFTEGLTPIRAGRLRLINAYGSELLDSRVEVRAEYWDGSRWATNTLDGSTPLNVGMVAISNAKGAGFTAPANPKSVSATLTGGVGWITFNKTTVVGSFDVALNLNASGGSDTSCNPNHGGTAANIPWLQGFWGATTVCKDASNVAIPAYQQDPSARVKFGSPKAPYIYLRERY